MFILDEILEDMANEGKIHFSPHYVCTRSGISDLKAVTEYLLRLVNHKLVVNFEVECPDGDSDFSIKTPEELKSEPKDCHICGRNYLPNPERVWIIFDFTEKYMEYVKKKK